MNELVFESAADAVVSGDLGSLRRLLALDASLVFARSGRPHRATLLHYVGANGVEEERQRTPPNVVEVTRVLLDAGASVDATADLYGGGSTPLGLAVTSIYPVRAGVLVPLLDTLFEAGASVEGLLMPALGNQRPEGAAWLADHGAEVDLVSAAGLGRLDLVRTYIDVPGARLGQAVVYASRYGHIGIVAFLLERGADPGEQDANGFTGLHWAAHGGYVDIVRLLLAHGAPLEVQNRFGGTVLGQALWSAENAPLEAHPEIISLLRHHEDPRTPH